MIFFRILSVLVLSGYAITVNARSSIVDTALANVGMYYDQAVCKVLEDVDCRSYYMQHDEQICGTDGKTYPNHCDFALARCRLILDRSNYDHTHKMILVLYVNNNGPCLHSPSTTPASTTQSIQQFLQSVLCGGLNSIDCSNIDINVVCGSDGQYYANECELSKAVCSNPTLTTEDITKCTASTSSAMLAPSPATTTLHIAWSAWFYGQCSLTCGNGTTSRIRHCSTGRDEDCLGPAFENVVCQNNPCASWSTWFNGQCSVTCGGGTTSRLRHCSSGHDVDCLGSAIENVVCHEKTCPVDGMWGAWQFWSACSASCGNGTQTRTRKCDYPVPASVGAECQGEADETIVCNTQTCPPHWLEYQAASACSVTCGQGVILYLRNCSTGNRVDCTGSHDIEKPCSLPAC